MGKKHVTAPAGCLCQELQHILRVELERGNAISEPPNRTDWPEPGSVFASLAHDFKTRKNELPKGVLYSICNDPHHGWYGEYFCEIHKHLLVAGLPRQERPMWQPGIGGATT